MFYNSMKCLSQVTLGKCGENPTCSCYGSVCRLDNLRKVMNCILCKVNSIG